MNEMLERIAIHIVNNLKDTPKEVERINKALQDICYVFGYPVQLYMVDDDINWINYVDCNGKITIGLTWEEVKQLIPDFIFIEEDCEIFVKIYMREE